MHGLSGVGSRGRVFAALLAAPVLGCECAEEGLVDARARLVIEPQSIDFGRVPVGAQRISALKLTNKGQVTLVFDRFALDAISDEIVLASPGMDRLGPEQSVELTLVYEPRNTGEDTAALAMHHDSDEREVTIAIRGEGVQAGAGVTHDGEPCGDDPRSLSFGNVVPGEAVERTLTVAASGTAGLTILSAVVEPGSSGEWSIQAIEAPVALSPGEAIALTARYAPVDGGPDRGAFVITTDAPETPSLRVPVCGLGVAPAICASPVPLDLGAAGVGQSVVGTLRLESCGLEPVDLLGVELASDAQHPTDPAFSLLVSPPAVLLQPGDAVTVDVEFTAAALGAASGFVKVRSTALNNTETFVPVIARGARPCDLLVAPSSVSFHGVQAGSTSRKTVLAANNGSATCEITRVEVGAGSPVFSVVSPPGSAVTLGPGASVLFEVEYAPSGAGPHTGVLEIEEGGVARTVDLLGNPDLSDGCHLQVVPPFLSFGAVPPGAVRTMGVELENVSTEICFLRGVELDPSSHPDLVETSPSLGLIAPSRKKQLSVTYRPTAPGSATGTLIVATNDVATGTFQVPIFAISADAGLCVEPRSLDFGPSAGSATLAFNIRACGSRTVTVTALDWSVPDAEISLASPPALPLTLQPGQSRAVDVLYVPQDGQGDTAVVTVRSDDPVDPAVDVHVTGGPEIVPPEAGRFLFYWQIPSPVGGDVMRMSLQGAAQSLPWWGPRTGKGCAGCHSVSPDGRYVAVIEVGAFRIVDTTTDIALALPNGAMQPQFVAWRPNVLTDPPYQYAFDAGGDIQIGAVFDGTLRTLQGAADPSWVELMPSWGSSGRIAFVRGMVSGNTQNGGFGFDGPTDILVVDENGGVAVPLTGASGGGASYYPAFSPNAQWIAFTYSAAAVSTIAAADAVIKLAKADNSGLVLGLPNANHAPGDGATSYPTWSVDGTYLSFSSNRSGGRGDWDIYLAPVDPLTGADGPAMNLTGANGSGFEHAAQWSP